ncbi:hypothetical protein KVT40_008946 [Elsinoe batatas]|uniref:Apple domain-containing protein n=1 Tax=Elsinoe batatas TaxID=2601811 RepID=A0A8K0P9Y4_9PEZI|nr:hypothetical protein KVT40_008946 [Elsinoe batatas]
MTTPTFPLPILRPFLLPLLFLLLSPTTASFGNHFSTGPTGPGNFIRTANSTLIVPRAPRPQMSLLSLWTGMGTSNGDLIQALVESYAGDLGNTGGGSEWCSYTSTLNGSGQVGGPQRVTKPGDRVKMSYMLNDETDMYDQYVYLNGELISTFSTASGRALGWGTAEECQPEAPCSIVPKHDWVNTVLVLDQPQLDYNNTFGSNKANGTLTTTDGGKTWKGARITIGNWDSGPSCPWFDKQNVTTRTGSTFGIECGVRHRGGNIKVVQPGNFMSCIEMCEKAAGCVHVDMVEGKCFLKSTVGAAFQDSKASYCGLRYFRAK